MNFHRKYRPKCFSEVVGNRIPIRTMKNIIKSGDIPNGMPFYGPAGTGKTTLAHLFIKGILCENFLDDICGKCDSCLSLEDNFSGLLWVYEKHDCSRIDGKELERIVQGFSFAAHTRIGRQIHVFDEFHRARESFQERLLRPLEFQKHLLLIFCLIDYKKLIDAFRQRLNLVLRTRRPEMDELIQWLKNICVNEGIIIKEPTSLTRIAIEADCVPRESLSVLETIYHRKEPMTVDLVKDVAQDRQGRDDNEAIAP